MDTEKVDTTLVVKEHQNLPGSPGALLEIALRQNADVDKLERLMALQEKAWARQDRIDFFTAFAQFQAAVPELKKDKNVKFKQKDSDRETSYWYIPLAHIATQIRQALQTAGLSYRWEQTETPALITVTCIVTHVGGHSERVTISGQPDTSGKKNGIQERASTITYLQRYTLVSALGLASADMDNDGQGGAAGKVEGKKGRKIVTPEKFPDLKKAILSGKASGVDNVLEHYELTPEQEQELRETEKTKADAKLVKS